VIAAQMALKKGEENGLLLKITIMGAPFFVDFDRESKGGRMFFFVGKGSSGVFFFWFGC